MKKRNMPFLGIGAASILLVLTIVSLSVFAVLTLSSAKGDEGLSKKLADRTTRYYKASNEANHTLEQVDRKLWKLFQSSENEEDYMKNVPRRVAKIDGMSYDKQKEILSFEKEITKEQKLSVWLKISYPKEKGDSCFRIIKWKNETSGEWEKDTSLPVYQKIQKKR